MPDEFGTVNVRRGERAREIEIIRQQYKRHRDALTSMIADAPTEHLAGEYQRLIGELDSSLMKLNELEAPGAAAAAGTSTATKRATDTQPMPVRPEPGTRPLVSPPTMVDYDPTPTERARGNRFLLFAIVVAGLVVLGVLGWLMWRGTSDDPVDTPIVTETTETVAPDDETTTVRPATPVTPATPPPVALRLEPASHNFGVIRKGTRAVRQYEVTNTTDQPITITVTRSACRCLYYSHAPVVPPRGKETITVTIDGARAKVGTLQENVQVTAKTDPSIAASLNVTATVR